MKLELRVALGGQALEDRFVQGANAGTDLLLGGRQEFTDWLRAKLEVLAKVYAYHASGLFSDEGKPLTGIFLRDAYVAVTPAEPLEIRAGVLRTAFSTLPSLMYPRGFPGVMESISFGSPERAQASLTLRQEIPTSPTLGLRSSLEPEGVPSLLAATALVQGTLAPRLTMGAGVSWFRFDHLSNGSARDSRFLGNSTTLGGYAYLYGYEGVEASVGFEHRFAPGWSAGLRGAGIANFRAPDGANNGASLTASLGYENRDYTVATDLMIYRNESDTLPAAYTSSELANNNRAGISAGARVDLRRFPIAFYGRLIRANAISATDFQADRNVYIVGTEATYEIL